MWQATRNATTVPSMSFTHLYEYTNGCGQLGIYHSSGEFRTSLRLPKSSGSSSVQCGPRI
jgi:hypothetical protein